MELKCNLCGKTYTDPNRYTECVMRCNELRIAKEDEEKRKKAAATRDDRHKRMKELFDELTSLAADEYLDPTSYDKGSVYEIVWPKFDLSRVCGDMFHL